MSEETSKKQRKIDRARERKSKRKRSTENDTCVEGEKSRKKERTRKRKKEREIWTGWVIGELSDRAGKKEKGRD